MSLYFSLKRFITLFAALSLLLVQLGGTVAQASMVGTDSLLQTQQGQAQRAELTALLDRDDVRNELVRMGVDHDMAKERIAHLTDSEVSALSQDLAELPAGSSGVVGVLVVIFIVFVVTDALGATDVFPFVHSINK